MRKPVIVTDAEETIGRLDPRIEISCYEIAANKQVVIPLIESPVWDDSTLGEMRGACLRATVALILYDRLVLHYDGALDRRLATKEDNHGLYVEHRRDQFSGEELSKHFDSSPWEKIEELEKTAKADVGAAEKGDEAARYRLRRNLNLTRLALLKEIVSQEEGFEIMKATETENIELSHEAAYALFMEVATSRLTGPLLARQAAIYLDAVWKLTKPELVKRGYRDAKVEPNRYYEPHLNRHNV